MKNSDFEAFFESVHGRLPFPWQARLARSVCEQDDWPRVIDLPTGSGKTATLDVAVFHLLVAASAGRPTAASRRIAFVVDRRIIVDEAAVRAQRIARAIYEATGGILREAADILEALSGHKRIDVLTLRGGVPRETNLVRDPTTASILLSTVDQLGSRLLFRGYGVRDHAKPMHAGMFGYDTLLLLDEAHIAEPFRQTLASIQRELRRTPPTMLGTRPLAWSQLSATPSGDSDFSLDDEDRRHEVLARRLEARKPMRLHEVARREDLTRKLVELVRAELAEPALSTAELARIGVVVNRVATAREVHSVLVRALKDSADVHLLVGRSRPLDRDRLLRRIGPALMSSEVPRRGERPIVVVATQTIEVGADLDFHSMFVEAASYAALRQRVGRLNRLGMREQARGAIVLVEKGAEEDPVYGQTIASTWALLVRAASDGVVDLGIVRAPKATPETATRPPATPELSPSLLDLLAQTSPRPAVEPDVAQFLHGFEERAADVSVVWRAGITGADGDTIDEALGRGVLTALPPLALEAMSLPLSSTRSWLAARHSKKVTKFTDAGDIEGEFEADGDEFAVSTDVLLVEDEDARLVPINRVAPGSMIVVPTAWGGADDFGFAPESKETVTDLSLAARRESRRSACVVLIPDVVRGWLRSDAGDAGETAIEDAGAIVREVASDDFDASETRGVLMEWIDANRAAFSDLVRDTLNELVVDRFDTEALLAEDGTLRGVALRARRPRPADLADVHVGLLRTVEVELHAHCKGVGEYADRFARAVGLPVNLVEDLRLAGRLHDLGKADPRFQAMLGADGTTLLAKGKGGAFERSVVLGARHECYSVALIDRHGGLLRSAHDPDLVRYLVGAHHGRGRGLHAVVADPGTAFELVVEDAVYPFDGSADLGSLETGWGDLFDRLQRRYGYWGLAYLETVLRLADHRRSEAELEGKHA